MFHAAISNDKNALNAEAKNYKDVPLVSNVTHQQVMDNYFQIKLDIKQMLEQKVARLKEEVIVET